MDHIAIMNPRWKLIPKILAGVKTIESRWYQTRRTPWDRISAGDTVYFKDAGKPVTARAVVAEALQFELASLADARRIVQEYGQDICLVNPDPTAWGGLPRYCVLVRLSQPEAIAPFAIDKTGIGSAAAWISLPDVNLITLPTEQ